MSPPKSLRRKSKILPFVKEEAPKEEEKKEGAQIDRKRCFALQEEIRPTG